MGLFDKLKKTFIKDDIVLYDKGLEKTRTSLLGKLSLLNNKYKNITDEYFDDLEEILLMADIGVNTTFKFVERLKERVAAEKMQSPDEITEIIIDELFIVYVNNQIIKSKINVASTIPTVVLVVGVNGVGKTTSIAKLGSRFKEEGKKVLLVAADTFRAGAREQLMTWGSRLSIDVFASDNSDPASVVFDGLSKAIKEQYDVVFIDTAGRLQNKENLMLELSKINKVIKGLVSDAPHETLLVIDATTGQNGISQAKKFSEIVDLTGIVLTKVDGTAKGGIVLAIRDEVNVPVKFIGLGETEKDLEVFDIEKYLYSLFKGGE